MKKVITHTETVVKETVRYILGNHEKRLIKKLVKRDGNWFRATNLNGSRFFTFNVKRDHLNNPKSITMVVIDFIHGNSHAETVNLIADWRYDYQGHPTWPTKNGLTEDLSRLMRFGGSGSLKTMSIKNPFKKYLNFP